MSAGHRAESCFLFRWLGHSSKIVYVESIARVEKLSMSGLILYKTRVADAIFVQWPELQSRYPRSLYAGRIM